MKKYLFILSFISTFLVGPVNATVITETFDSSLSANWTGDWAIGSGATVSGQSILTGNALISANIGDSATSNAIFNDVFEAGFISFDIAISAEGFFDSVGFYIDGVVQDLKELRPSSFFHTGLGLDGVENDSYTFLIDAGSHTLQWSYVKDSSISSGTDNVGIDNFVFQSTQVPEPTSLALLGLGFAGFGFTRKKKNA